MANLLWLLSRLDLRSLIDILLVSGIVYGVLVMVQGTQAVQLLRGVILLALTVLLFGSIAELTAFNWLLRSTGQALLVVVAIILQPELRRAIDRLGRAGGLALWSGSREVQLDRVVREIATACHRLSLQRHGALIVIERETGLQDYVETGVTIDGLVVASLIQTIFYPGTSLHDGAIIIRDGNIIAAGCLLPLAETITTETHLGTRHRAALGMSERTDAVVVVVSEETGIISMARNGRIVRHLDERRLTTLLQALLRSRRDRRRSQEEERERQTTGGTTQTRGRT